MDRKIVVAIAVTLAVTGCGGSGTLSRADFVKQANAICRHRQAEITSLQTRYSGDFRHVLVAALPMASKGLDQLKALKPPSNLKHSYEQFLAGERTQLEHVRAIVAAQKAGRRPPSSSETVESIHRQARITRSLGLDACV